MPAAACKAAGVRFVHDKTVPADAAPVIAAAARKVGGVLNLGECNAIEKAGPESHFADALGARIALEVARSEGARLSNSRSPVVVDDAAVKALTQIVDAASARLQKESDVAIGRGELENLQLLTAVSAALSRDLLSVKEMADRLRGVGAAPRLGAGALDPEVVLPGQHGKATLEDLFIAARLLSDAVEPRQIAVKAQPLDAKRGHDRERQHGEHKPWPPACLPLMEPLHQPRQPQRRLAALFRNRHQQRQDDERERR